MNSINSITATKKIEVKGTQATHEVEIFERILDTPEYYKRKEAGLFENWSPENGSRFDTLGKALGWLKKLLGKPGWPESTKWEIYRCINNSGYQIFNTK